MSSATFVSDVAAAAVGQWPGLLASLGIVVPPRNKHGPCPACGGNNPFRFDDKKGRGTFICNRCGAGDGLDLVRRVTGKPPKDAAELVAGVLGLSHVVISEAEREQIRQQQRERADVEQQQQHKKRQKAAIRAAGILRDCKPGQSDYLAHKRLSWPSGLLNSTLIRVGEEAFPAGSLVVPLYNETGELVNVQLIRHDGVRHYLAGGQKQAACHRIPGSALVAVCEGYATGLSVHLATGATVYCAMDAGNLLAIAQVVRGMDDPLQPCRLWLAADNDATTTGNPGKTKAEQAAAAVGAVVALPPTAGDWNDYHQAHGLEETKRAIMSQIEQTQQQDASQKEEPLAEAAKEEPKAAEVITLRPGLSNQGVEIGKMAPSQRAELLRERLGEVAVNIVAATVYRYTGSLWEHVSDAMQRREMAAIYADHGVPFSSKMLSGVVDTMKEMIPLMAVPRDDLIGFANGVYDMAARAFRPHSPADGLLSHNGITYGEPLPGETLETSAPYFSKWLAHAAESDVAKMERIKAALFMVLANRYDWQLFLEVTGEGGSGKSVMANLCELLVGSRNVGSSSMKRLESDFGLESVWDKRLILLPDQPKYAGDGATLKAITGGDEVSINQKGKPMFSGKVRAVVLATNNEPMVFTERRGGVSRRRVIFTFNNVVAEADKDPQLGEKIAAELPVIIRHLLARFADPLVAKELLLEQRNSTDAIAVKRATDPLFDLCAMVEFIAAPNGMRMGGKTDVLRNPRRYFYHAYLAYMEYHGLERPHSVNAVSRSLKQMAKELGSEYKTRRSDGVITNIVLTDEVDEFMPKPGMFTP
ncbi:toprim domain-containing protein [Aeromonas veronii]|uniref:toprim domain-containing protein n=1 Tax=Aeromonas veronii TaxID=654 RepID=UPI00111ADEE9|nr:toprim domain-containing protein [Aeromonas veronii]MCX0422561.1 toprim domain-containing protein [Aeromonas veronii]TNI71736.1 DNA primase [Aeromonas veronii]